MPLKQWLLQDKNFALGNFINITPIAKHYYFTHREAMDVFFETEYVKQCYITSPYIRILDQRPAHAPLASSSLVCKSNKQRDYQYAFEQTMRMPFDHKHHKPFIDEPVMPVYSRREYAVIINGSGSERADYVDSKDPGAGIYIEAIRQLEERDIVTIFVGSIQDLNRNKEISVQCDQTHVGDIRKALHLIRYASYIITNDTGLAHAAGTWDKRMLVYWKNTPNVRVKNSGANTVYSDKSNWLADTKSFINKL